MLLYNKQMKTITIDEMITRFEMARQEEELHRWMVEAIRRFVKQHINNKQMMDMFIEMVKKEYPNYLGYVEKIMVLV